MSRSDYYNKKLAREIQRFSNYVQIASNEEKVPGLRNDASRSLSVIRDRIHHTQGIIQFELTEG